MPRRCWRRALSFLAHDDERLRNTVLAIAEELTENGFVLRYRTDETDDGLSGKEGTFLICSFWLVSAFAIVGELQRATRPDGAAASDRLSPWSLCRGVRPGNREASGELPAGVLPPRANRGRSAHDRPRTRAFLTRGPYDVITLTWPVAASGKRGLPTGDLTGGEC